MSTCLAFISGLIGAFIFGFIGGALGRWRGHASKYKKYFPRPCSQIALSLPYAFVAYQSGGVIVSLVVFAIALLGWLTGHGNFFIGGKNPTPYEPETTEPVILWLKPHLPDYIYRNLGMAVTGLVVTIPCGIVTLNPFIALSGALKAPAYMIGHYIHTHAPMVRKINGVGNSYNGVRYLPRHLDLSTEIGEFLTGFLLWSSLWLLV